MMAPKPGVWNPTTAFLAPLCHDDEVYQEPVPDRTHAPRNGLPVPVAYTYYRGGDFTVPPEPAVDTARPVFSWAGVAARARPWHDPEWLAGPPVSAPAEWVTEDERQARGDL